METDPAPEDRRASEARGRRVLVVEHETDTALSLIQSLEATGLDLSVEATPSARRAVELVTSQRVDCLLVGGGFQQQRGSMLLDRVRDAAGTVPVVRVADPRSEGDQAGREGPDAYLGETEPDPARMRAVIEMLLDDG